MKAIQKIRLYAAAGAVLLGTALGCGKKESPLEYNLKAEPKVEHVEQRTLDTKGPESICAQALTDLADSYTKFNEQLDATSTALEDAIAFEKEYKTEMAKLDAEEKAAKRDAQKWKKKRNY